MWKIGPKHFKISIPICGNIKSEQMTLKRRYFNLMFPFFQKVRVWEGTLKEILGSIDVLTVKASNPFHARQNYN